MNGKAVIFDLDGTLLNTLQDLADSMNRVLEKRKYKTHPLESYRYFVGRGAVNLVKSALGDVTVEEEIIKKIYVEFNSEYKNNWDNTTEPYPGIREMLKALEKGGVKKGILSNKPHDFVLLTVNRYFPEISFVPVFGVREGYPVKPDPVQALEIASAWNLPPEEILYLGDSDVDMETAKRAGMIPLGVSWGFRSKEELQKSGATKVLENPQELLTLL